MEALLDHSICTFTNLLAEMVRRDIRAIRGRELSNADLVRFVVIYKRHLGAVHLVGVVKVVAQMILSVDFSVFSELPCK
jgi:hypothetical protein